MNSTTARFIVTYTTFLFIALIPQTIHASSCTNTLTSTTTIPTGYGASYNLFSSAKELLVRASCSGTTATLTVGSQETYTHTTGYSWNGTSWQNVPLACKGSTVSTSWCVGEATASVTLTENPATLLGYTCYWSGTSWKCGCRDSACTTSYWQMQRVGVTNTISSSDTGRPSWVGTWGIWGGENYTFPWLKGSVVSCTWAQLEKIKGTYDFTCLDNKFSKAIANNQKVMPLIYIDQPPEWVWDTVPKVETDGTSGKVFPYYLDSDYKIYVKALWGALLKHVATKPSVLNIMVAQQLPMGRSGDQEVYEGTPNNPAYVISDAERSAYHKEMVTAWLDVRDSAGLNVIPLLNVGQGTFDMMESLGEPYMRKDGMRTQMYQMNREMNAISIYEQLSRKVDSDYVRSRGEFDEPVKLNTGWLTVAPLWHYYWHSLWVLTWGIDILNQRTQSLSKASSYEEAFTFFTDHAGYKNPRTAKYAYVALRDGLDIANTARFPEATYGILSGINSPTRYQKIATAMAPYGARQDDVINQTLGGLDSGKNLTGINDVGYMIWQDNYGKYLEQIDPLETSQGYWRVGSLNEPYGRYARGFNTSKGMSRMYFNVDDRMFAMGSLAGTEQVQIRIVYFDKGTGTWALNYDAVGNVDKQTYSVTKTNTGLWKEKIINVSDAYFGNRGPRNSDISLVNKDSEEDIFHMIEITFIGR